MAGARENVCVCVRVRPCAEGASVWALDAATNRVAPTEHHPALARRAAGSVQADDEERSATYDFRYDRLVLADEPTEQVYVHTVYPVVRAAMEGYNGTVFAYGQTGSGKTYTMSGTRSAPGVIPCAVRDVFTMIQEAPEREFLLRVSYLEIYNETLKDLLAPVAPSTPSRRGVAARPVGVPRIVEERGRVVLTGMQEEVVTTPDEVLALLERGQAARHVGATDWNTRSSRSHSVFQITIESREEKAASGVRVSQLNLIDLAGSERAASEAARRKEGAYINKSLLTLGTVIAKLTEPHAQDTHIPYRDSKLTRLLQTSLSGDARVAVICTIAQESAAAQETLSTLKFGRRCKMVVTKAQKHVTVDDKALLEQYRKELDTLRARLEASPVEEAPSTPPADLEALRSEHAAAAQQVAEMRETRQGLKAQIDHLTRLILTSRSMAEQAPQRAQHEPEVFASPRRGPRMSDLPPRTPVQVPERASAEMAALRRELRTTREAHHDELHGLHEALAAARVRAEEAWADADDAKAEVREMHIAVQEAQAEADALRADYADARTECEALQREADEARADAEEARADAEEARSAYEALQREADEAHAEADAARADAEAARADAHGTAQQLRDAREEHATDEAHREFRELVGSHRPLSENDAAQLHARIAALERALAEERATRDLNSLPERPPTSPMRARGGMTPPRVPLRTRSTDTTPEPEAGLRAQIEHQKGLIASLNQSVAGWQTRVQLQARKIAQLAAMVMGEGEGQSEGEGEEAGDTEAPRPAETPRAEPSGTARLARGWERAAHTSEAPTSGPSARRPRLSVPHAPSAPAPARELVRSPEEEGCAQAASRPVPPMRRLSQERPSKAASVPAPSSTEGHSPASPPQSDTGPARRPLPQPASAPARRTLPTPPSRPLVPSGSVAALRASLTAPAPERTPLPPVPSAPSVARAPRAVSGRLPERDSLRPLPESPSAPVRLRAGGPPPSQTVRARLSAFDEEPRQPALHKDAPPRQRDASILRELNHLRAMPRVESSRTMYTPHLPTELTQTRLSAATYKTDASQYYI